MSWPFLRELDVRHDREREAAAVALLGRLTVRPTAHHKAHKGHEVHKEPKQNSFVIFVAL
jgi:hypothetical protein